MTRETHWDATYERTPLERLGWFEADPEVSLNLVQRSGVGMNDLVLDVGSGASTLLAALVARGFTRLAAVDISAVALERLRDMLAGDASKVRFILGDITARATFDGLEGVALWHDRAALHFLTEPDDRAAYARAVHSTVRLGGAVILAAFAIGGATECSNLPVVNYDAVMFSTLLGDGFTLEESRDHVYINPGGGERPYVYALFRRTA